MLSLADKLNIKSFVGDFIKQKRISNEIEVIRLMRSDRVGNYVMMSYEEAEKRFRILLKELDS